MDIGKRVLEGYTEGKGDDSPSSACYSLDGHHLIRYVDKPTSFFDDELGHFEARADEEVATLLKTLSTYYRVDAFTGDDFSRHLDIIREETDLVILDHFHYVDSDYTNENRGHKELVKKIRDTAPTGRPSGARRWSRQEIRPAARATDPDEEAFHGSSDIVKIATKAIMIAPDYATRPVVDVHAGREVSTR